jgi:photosynthetic reaction center cytochrome c subunit
MDSGGGAAGESGKKTEEVFKNIQVLKGISSEQLIPSMQFMAASLGVECRYCHVPGHFEKDDKKEKQTARAMIRMMSEINATDFASKREVTCYSCQRGVAKPAGTPALEPAPVALAAETAARPRNLPTVQRVLDRYIDALGGAAAIERITSRTETGVSDLQGRPVSIEVFTQSPNKWAMVLQLPNGSSVSVFDGQNGWFAVPREPVRNMHPGDLDAAKKNSDLHFALHVQQMFPDLQLEYPESLHGHESDVLLGVRDGQPAAKFYFEEDSGLLVRVVRYADSPLGLNPSQTDYGDYREVDGVQVPFQVTLTSHQGIVTVRFNDIKQNVPIDAARFLKPEPR